MDKEICCESKKIGISDAGIANKWGDKRYKKLKAFGFDCFDFDSTNTTIPPYTYCQKDFIEFFKNEKKLADDAGITVWQMHGPWRSPKDSTVEEREERLEKMERSICGAALLGAKFWVVHPIMPFGIKDITTGNQNETRELNFEFMSKLLKTARREGVTICLENMPFVDFSLSSPTAIADFVKEIDDPFFAMCLDTGHANVCADWLSPANAVRKYGKYIKALHIHDNKGIQDDHRLPFYGTIDWADFSRAIFETNFDGVMSLECAPSKRLPDDILDETYLLYAKVAKRIYECHTY